MVWVGELGDSEARNVMLDVAIGMSRGRAREGGNLEGGGVLLVWVTTLGRNNIGDGGSARPSGSLGGGVAK